MKHIEVVAAIIRKDDKIFATQRGYGDFKDWWEFPGGKMEPGETPEEALKREIQEELSTDISVDKFLCTVDYDYPQFHLTMHCYFCSLLSEALHLNEHEAAKWLSKDELDDVNWIPADIAAVDYLKETMVDHKSIMEKMKKVDEEMQKCGYDLDRLKELYENTDDKFEKQLIYAEIRSIEILNSIHIDANGE